MEKTAQRALIMIPYAYLNDTNTGRNIGDKGNQIDIYMKNCCVACISARKHNDPDTDVALVTNIDPPPAYRAVLDAHDVKILHVDFDMFNFDGKYAWALAFYKLCALYHAVHDYEYDYYAFLDSDVYVQSDFRNIWKESESHILLYDINDGLQDKNYVSLLCEIQTFTQISRGGVDHYGGEFFAANRENAKLFAQICKDIYLKMRASSFITTRGDEFITTVASLQLKNRIRNAGAYIRRFWTGSFRLTSTCYKYDPVAVLHVPSEKERGMLSIYDRYVRHGKLPANSRVHRILHLTRPSMRTQISQLIKRFKN